MRQVRARRMRAAVGNPPDEEPGGDETRQLVQARQSPAYSPS